MKLSLKGIACLGIAALNLAAVPALADPAGNWAGTYAGGFVGGTWSDFSSGSDNESSFMGGGDVGHNWQYDHMILGLEGDMSKFNNHVGSNGVKFTEDWMSTMRARAGYGFDRYMPYVTGGLALTDTVSKVSGVGSEENVAPGYTVGGGLDTMLSQHWVGRVEYLYADVPRDSSTIGGTNVAAGSGNHNLRVGVNYLF